MSYLFILSIKNDIKKMLKKTVRDIFKSFDYFGVVFTFKYKSEDKYRTAIGGLSFLIFLGISLTYGMIIGIPILKREKMTLIDYQMQTIGTDNLNFKKYFSSFGIGIICPSVENKTELEDLFEFEFYTVRAIKENGTKNIISKKIPSHKCTYADFFNQLNKSIDILSIDLFFCPDTTDVTLNGYFADVIFDYVEIILKIKNSTKENFEKIKRIFGDECTLGFYYSDYAFNLFDFNSPIQMFFTDKLLPLKFSEMAYMNAYFKLVQIDSYENFFFENYNRKSLMSFSSYDLFYYYKGENRNITKPKNYEIFAKVDIRADMIKEIIERKYTKLTEFAANVSSILSAILLFMFLLVSFINKFYSNQSVMHRIFQFNPSKKGRKKHFAIRKVINKNALLFEQPEYRFASKFYYIIFLARTISDLNSRSIKSMNKVETQETLTNFRVDSEISKASETKREIKKAKTEEPQITVDYNLIELFYVMICPSCSWKKLQKKNILFKKALDKIFFQLDVLNFLKHMQQQDILNYSLLDHNENIILQFLSKPSISLAQKKDIYDKINTVNDINVNEANELYSAVKQIFENKDKTNFQKRLLKLTKSEMGLLIKKMKAKDK